MKKFLSLIAVIAALSTSAFALTLNVGDGRYLGYVSPNLDAGVASETLFVETLVNLNPGDYASVLSANSGQVNTVSRSTNVFPALPEPVIYIDRYNVGDSWAADSEFSLTGIHYVLAKYGKYGTINNIAFVWYVGDTTDTTAKIGVTKGLSHVSVFDPPVTTTVSVAESGSTALMLIGGFLTGLAVWFRRD